MDAQVVKLPNGDYALGFYAEGVFVPVVTVEGHRVASYVDRYKTLVARAKDPSEEGHEEAKGALASLVVGPEPKGKGKAKEAEG